jgi:hypothetical protein
MPKSKKPKRKGTKKHLPSKQGTGMMTTDTKKKHFDPHASGKTNSHSLRQTKGGGRRTFL